jgi:superfamily II DNA or RNA helicase
MPQINQFPQGIKFKYPWRNYQKRVLKELTKHLQDRHLHVVAPPGSGKTVLGLEVALRLNAPTLILAPTVAIRNQWVNRFCELFIQTATTPSWISTDIHNPKFLTVATYQGLHAACNNQIAEEYEPEEEDEETEEEPITTTPKTTNFDVLLAKLKKQNIGTIVVDEAHHLKNEWWKTLDHIKNSLNPFIVGLTATPPYDVNFAEWERYLELNGAVDAEITVPELVQEGDLCPHQDYIYFCTPQKEELKKINAFRENIDTLFEEIKNDEDLIEAISQHPLFLNPEEHLDYIYNNLSYYSSILIFLSTKIEIPLNHFELVGNDFYNIPKLDTEWLATLLEFYLFKERNQFEFYRKHQRELERKLRHYSIIEHKQINFNDNKTINSLLTSSISKLNAINDIADFEYHQLGKNLRMVILTDYIRKEFLVSEVNNTAILNKIGVASIFEKLRRNNTANKKIGILTGSIVIIPKEALASLEQKNKKYGIEAITVKPLVFDENYLQLNVTPKLKHNIVHTVTELFQDGDIEILIGTKALLGEGWDAPAVNALILASFVGSFVLSNQMRGRAIRTQKNNPLKTGNVWHLACIDFLSKIGGKDLELMKRRFKSFVGIAIANTPHIESGTDRLEIPENIHLPYVIKETNSRTFKLAAQRKQLKQKWDTAVKEGSVLSEQIRIPYPYEGKKDKESYLETKTLYYNKTLRNVSAELGFGVLAFGETIVGTILENLINIKTPKDVYTLISILGISGMVIFGRRLYVTAKLYFKYRDIAKDIRPIAKTVFDTLIDMGIIKTPREEINISTYSDDKGAVYCYLEGGTTFEKSTFINALQEIITPIDNPRYVIIRESKKLGLIRQYDYHAVPEVIGRTKKTVTIFRRNWKLFVGKCSIIFTRTPQGRKLLLQSRLNALSTQLSQQTQRVNKWR